MKLKSIKISNILSFEWKENIEDADLITLDPSLNILIWSNGAWKSNFLEVINQLFKRTLYKDYFLQEGPYLEHKNGTYVWASQNIVTLREGIYQNLSPNKYSWKEEGKIKLELLINKKDLENLVFILDNFSEISTYLSTYVSGPTQFNNAGFNKSDLEEFYNDWNNSVQLYFEKIPGQISLIKFPMKLPKRKEFSINMIWIFLAKDQLPMKKMYNYRNFPRMSKSIISFFNI